MKGANRSDSTRSSQPRLAISLRTTCFALAMIGVSACALPHATHGEVDTGPIIDEQFADRIALGDADVFVVPDTLDAADTPIVPADVVDDDATVPIDVPDVPPPIDTPDVPPPIDIPIVMDVPPDRIIAIDVVDVPPPRDVPPPMDVPTTTPAGSACSAGSTTCASGAECFSYGLGGEFCADCGGYGDRACAGRTCREGSYDMQSDSCIHSVGSHAGEPGGSCGRSSDCGTLGQCVPVAGYSGRACLACGSVGQACCCPSGYLPSCTCNAGATCTAVTGTYWTVCR